MNVLAMWSPVGVFATRFLTRRLRFLIGEKLLCRLLELLQQPPMIAGPLDGCLQLFAQLRQPLEALLVREVLSQRMFNGHGPVACLQARFVIAQSI
jgi:hypothetical protein